jgi:hypothetical protein
LSRRAIDIGHRITLHGDRDRHLSSGSLKVYTAAHCACSSAEKL